MLRSEVTVCVPLDWVNDAAMTTAFESVSAGPRTIVLVHVPLRME
jgi:hypothetical protein